MTDTPNQQNANRQQRTVDFIKRAYFRETTGGFVYRAPNPWLVGHADHYLVSAPQRDEIVAILSSPNLIPGSRPRPTPALIIGRIVVGLALMLVLPTVLWPNTPAIATVVFMLELLVFLLVGRHLSAQRRLTLLQPILASASKTSERLLPWTLRSALSPQTKATPRQMMIAGIINAALFVLFTPNAISSWQRHGVSLIDPFWLLVVVPIYFGIIAAINFYWALKKQDSAVPKQISARLGIGLILLVSAVLSLSLGNHLYHGFHDRASTRHSSADLTLGNLELDRNAISRTHAPRRCLLPVNQKSLHWVKRSATCR